MQFINVTTIYLYLCGKWRASACECHELAIWLRCVSERVKVVCVWSVHACARKRKENYRPSTTHWIYVSIRKAILHTAQSKLGKKTYEWKKLLYIYLLLYAICQWNVIAAYITQRRNNIKYNTKNRNSNRNVNLKILWQLWNEWFFLWFFNNLTCFPSKLIQLL